MFSEPYESDTIAAVSTAPGKSGIAVVKISGPKSVSLVQRIFTNKHHPKFLNRTMIYGHIIDKKEHIDIVVLDMLMLDEKGIDTYKRLKRMNPDIRVLISSGSEKDRDVDEILNDGQNGFIKKPFKFEEFTYNIDTILSVK